MTRSARSAVAASMAVLAGTAALRSPTVTPGPAPPASAAPARLAADTPTDSFTTSATLAPHEAAKAEALIRRRLPCLGCHRLGDEGGRVGPDLTAVGARRSAAYIRAMILDPRATVPGTAMPRVPMPSETAELIAAYLAGRAASPASAGAEDADPTPTSSASAESSASAAPAADRSTPGASGADRTTAGASGAGATPARAPAAQGRRDLDGAPLYARHCAACHGVDGGGDGPNARHLPVAPTAHADSAYMSTRPDDALFDAIYAGGRIMGMSHRMPAWGWTLTREEIRALVRHLRTLCACEGPAWSRDGAGGVR